MSLIQKVPGTAFSGTLPKLYRDAVINSDTKFVYDALDTYSWSSQGAGPGTLVNLVDGGPTATVNSSVGFSGGFVFDDDSDEIALPSIAKLSATEAAFLFVLWIKQGATTSGTLNGVAGVGSALAAANNQYLIYESSNQIVIYFSGTQTYSFTSVANTKYQIGLAAKRRVDNTGYDVETYINGAIVDSRFVAVTSISVSNSPRIGQIDSGGGFQDNWRGTVYRTLFDKLQVKTAAEIVALDYAQNSGRFS